MYPLHQAQEDLAGRRLRPLALDAAGHLRAMDSGRPETLPLSQAAASLRLWESAGTTHQKPPLGLTRTRVGDRPVAVRGEVVLATPFCALRRFAKDVADPGPRVLVVAPLSGHFATRLRGTLELLLPGYDVHVTDWVDAREIPVAAGPFGLDDVVAQLLACLEAFGPARTRWPWGRAWPSPPPRYAEDATPPRPRSLTLVAGPVDARVNPSRDDVVVPVAPGGSLDALSRLFGRHLGELGQPWLVENQGAAGGNPAFETVARSRPDGHTLLWGWDTLAINPALYARVGYDPLRDFTPIAQMVRTAQLLVVRPGLPARSLAEFLDLARRRAVSVGSPGNGSIGHLAAELLRARAGASWTHVPYRGGGPAMADLLAGNMDAVSLTLGAAVEHVRAGRMRGLAVTTAARAPALPEVPTVAEAASPTTRWCPGRGCWGRPAWSRRWWRA